jgi:aminopeptidase YwaD
MCPNPSPIIGEMEGAMAHLRYLADDALEGRDTGTSGARCAADYLATFFQEMGVEGAGPHGSYFQDFEVRMGSILGSENSLRVGDGVMELEESWIPFGFAGSGTASGAMVYGGPGVSMPGNEMDRYAHLDIEGKIVVVEGADPHGSSGGSLMGDPHHKASIAAGRGAAAVLILLEDGATLPRPEGEQRPSVRIPALAISGAVAQAVREAAEAGAAAEITVSVDPRMVAVRNVVAMIPGTDATLAREVVVVGAHYDHLGHGGDGSLSPDSHDVHNGADDNASGTAALMEVARTLATAPNRPSRSVLFVAFTGEEKGLWGSGHYVNNPLIPLENTVAMMNMDMVGRLRDNTLTVYGTGTAEEFPALLEEVNGGLSEPFILTSIADGFGPSDHSSFYGESVPVLMLFTNTHADYHTPRDDWELIEVDGLNRIVGFASDLTGKLAGSEGSQALAVTYVESAGNPHGAMAAAADEEGGPPSRGYGAYMGTIPDMTPQDFGVRITGVREESPAEKAGLQAGDILVDFGGHEISDLYAYTYALREFQPGDEVVVVVIREGERISFTAVLSSRD